MFFVSAKCVMIYSSVVQLNFIAGQKKLLIYFAGQFQKISKTISYNENLILTLSCTLVKKDNFIAENKHRSAQDKFQCS